MLKNILDAVVSDDSNSHKYGLFMIILVSIVFVFIRVAVPMKFGGSYIDEYWHIISGVSFFETGAYTTFYNDVDRYDRGLLISLWTGFWMTLFGKSLVIAKLAPVSIAILNYGLFLYLTIKFFDKRRFQILLLTLYTLSPWIIFNHSYIRFYVVNEMFLLVLLVCGYLLFNAMRDENWKSVLKYAFLIIFLNGFNFIATGDESKYMLLIATAVMFSGFFIYEFNTGLRFNQKHFSAALENVVFSNKLSRALIVFIVATIGFVVLDAGSKLDFLLNGALAYTSQPGFKYAWLLWEKNGAISIFFVLAVATFWWRSSGYERIVLPVAGVLFVIHLASSEDLQLVRGFIYFLPLYFLVSVLGVVKAIEVCKLKASSQVLVFSMIGSVFIISTLTNVTKNFIYGPAIEYEVNYIEYAQVYDEANNSCADSLIVEAAPSSPFTASFHDVKIDYVLSTVENLDVYAIFYKDEKTSKYKTVWGDVPVTTSITDSRMTGHDVCLIVRRPSKKRYLSPEEAELLKLAEKSWLFHNIDLYLFRKETLLSMRH